jgi:hypothetical protein
VDVDVDHLDAAHHDPAQIDSTETGAGQVDGAELRAAEVDELESGATKIDTIEVSHALLLCQAAFALHAKLAALAAARGSVCEERAVQTHEPM